LERREYVYRLRDGVLPSRPVESDTPYPAINIELDLKI